MALIAIAQNRKMEDYLESVRRAGGEPGGLGEDRQLVAGQRLVGEDVVLQIAAAVDNGRPSNRLSLGRPDEDGRYSKTEK